MSKGKGNILRKRKSNKSPDEQSFGKMGNRLPGPKKPPPPMPKPSDPKSNESENKLDLKELD